MAQKYLDAVIRLMGQQMPSFTSLGQSIENLGAQVDRIGDRIREFEKDSVNVYKEYDDHMLGVRSTLIKTYDSMTIYARDMKSLEEYASQWASTSIFHTNDVAEAMEEAVHAGWNYTKIIEGIPNAMLIAQAGGMSLSEGLDYLINIMNTTHSEFDDMGTVIDQWARAANSSATTIDEMGQAFMTLSASAGFGDTTQELFTMAAVLANVGIKGSSAGTQLRNAMLRVVAPTKKAADTMAELGFTEDELAD
ncbi:MAG: phage tail tape measure protein [Clostridia bacterium]|nr:phage tail tape measure protein [Clostridia bacterium]